MTVQAWLDSERDYEVGRQLYEQLGDNARLKQVLGHGPSAYNREALVWELQKLTKTPLKDTHVTLSLTQPALGHLSDTVSEVPKKVQEEPSQLTDSEQNAPNSVQSEPSSAESGTELPSTAAVLLASLSQARRPLYDERTVLHQALEHQPTEADRLAAARRILQLSREVDANWRNDAHVREHGELPPPPPPAPGLETLTPAELVKKRNNLRSQVSKLKNKPHRANDLAKVEADLRQVEALLTPATS